MTCFRSSRRVRHLSLALVLTSFSGLSTHAHPEIEDALARINMQIATAPTEAALYLARGELYARHEDWVAAEANYLRAGELAPNLPRLAALRGALALATGHATEAKTYLDHALTRAPDDLEALILRGRAHASLGARDAARRDYDTALARATAPAPDLFLERAALLPADAAIRSLDEGIARLGSVVTLHLRALVLEESLGRIDAAAARLAQLAAESERPESWLKRRGDLFARAGRVAEARAAYSAALAAMDSLPEWLRAAADTRKLATELTRLGATRS